MSLETVVAGLSGTHQEVFEQVKARTVTEYKSIWGADIEDDVIQAGLRSLIKDKSEETGTIGDPLREMCIALMARMGAGGELDFRRPSVQALLDQFVNHPTVAAVISAGPYGSPAVFKAQVLAKAETQVPEFPGVTLRQIIEIREPALAQTTATNSRPMLSVIDPLVLYVQDAPPEPISAYAEISYGAQWARVPVTGLDNITTPGAYIFFLTGVPFPMIGPANEIRVVLPYNLNAYL